MNLRLPPVKNYTLLLFCGMFFLSNSSAQILESIEELDARNGKNITELLYIHTDREVYNPGDSLWFKAYFRNKASLYKSGFSKNFFLKLVNKDGVVVQEGKFLITDSQIHGGLTLKYDISEGVYFLNGYSSWMKNFGTDGIFTKRILIQNDRRKDLQMVAGYDRESYFPGDTMKIFINCYDQFNRDVTDVSFSYRILNGKSVAQRGRTITADSKKEALEYLVPDGLNDPPRLEINTIYKGNNLDTTFIFPVNYLVRVNFFPEGGHCVNGIGIRMAFKAESENGDPVEIAGYIIDNSGNIVQNIQSEHDGLGSFPYLPIEGQQHLLQLTKPQGFRMNYPLPTGQNMGWQLSARAEDDHIKLIVNQRNTHQDTALITVMVRDYLCYYKIIDIGNGITLEIPGDEIPEGIAVISLFNKKMKPVAERLVYNPPENIITARLETDRGTYVPRDRVSLKVDLSSGLVFSGKGSYSLSIIDDQLCSSDQLNESNIKTSFLLSPEIKGEIYKPNYYTNTEDKTVREHLDLLLLTQGWRNYNYLRKSGAGTTGKPVNQDVVSGRIMRQPWARNLQPTKGVISVYYGGNTTKFPVGEDGRFSFLPEFDINTNSGLFISAVDQHGRYKLTIQLDSTRFDNQIKPFLRKNSSILFNATPPPSASYKSIADQFSLGLDNHEWIEEVVVSKRVNQKEVQISDFVSDVKRATRDELDEAHDIDHLLQNMNRYNPLNKPVLYVVDDVYNCPTFFLGSVGPAGDNSMLGYISNPRDIAEFTVMRGQELQSLYCPGIEIVIDIKTNLYMGIDPMSWWENPIFIGKFTPVKEFYVPQYDTESKRRSVLPDLRKTIHWDPNLEISEEGTAKVEFYNGDRYTKIKCILEGISDKGIPVYSEHSYIVSLQRDDK